MIDKETGRNLDAAVLRRLLKHLDENRDVQNIDLMIAGGFCRNCLGRWYAEAANERGIDLTETDARERIYGMPYADWKRKYQKSATEEQLRLFAARHG
ncbi:MAG: DUF1244 domain-containing protein [Gammaproteobacteria bacterium]|nr:DUF1244 domain-containing protein [Gammaproteobacteria bacterium]MDE0414864.1 DUF1244 domain-containing protein [Gammaproteobacteria bacterium]